MGHRALLVLERSVSVCSSLVCFQNCPHWLCCKLSEKTIKTYLKFRIIMQAKEYQSVYKVIVLVMDVPVL